MKIILTMLILLPYLYDVFTLRLIDHQRKQPLPAEVADIYDAERYQNFLDYKSDSRKVELFRMGISLLLSLFLIWSPFFRWMESVTKQIYALGFLTAVVQLLLELVIATPFNYYMTFTVREKYGLNKATKQEFFKDFLLDQLFQLVIIFPLYGGLAFLLQHIAEWTNGFHAPYLLAAVVLGAILAVFLLFVFAVSFLSWFVMRRQYTFTELEEGELKDKIYALCKGAKRKIGKIEVYNESKKSNSKNAFLLKLLWIRRFGIADNFLMENSERQLLGVLAHEAGHLKHRKNIWNYLMYIIYAVVVLGMYSLMVDGSWVMDYFAEVKTVFGVKVLNPVLFELIVGTMFTPLFSLFGVFRNFVIRSEEYEADRNAVHSGYGEDLIQTFKEVSHDELVDVNPHPLIETLEFNHPGMYRRIQAIHSEMAKQ